MIRLRWRSSETQKNPPAGASGAILWAKARRRSVSGSFRLDPPHDNLYKRRGSYKLSDCHRNGHLIHVRCSFCKLSRYYTPDDLRKIFSDIEVDDVVYQMRCERGGRDHPLTLSAELISADKRQALTIRRLDKIVYERRVIWRDERG